MLYVYAHISIMRLSNGSLDCYNKHSRERVLESNMFSHIMSVTSERREFNGIESIDGAYEFITDLLDL